MSHVQTIITLLLSGARRRSDREIARLLGVERKTVARYRRLLDSGALETGPNLPTGSECSTQTGPNLPTGSECGAQTGPNLPTGPGLGPESLCAVFHEEIETRLEKGQHAKSIHYDLVRYFGFRGSYDSVKRYVRKIRDKRPELVQRLEFPYGDAAQVDFGTGAFVRLANGRRRKPQLFVLTLCGSRRAYREVVWNQKAETFIGCLQHGFEHFGGVTETLILDNLKAAVIKAIWHDPVFNKKFMLFCKHMGIAPLPCVAGAPQQKGIVENGVKYTQGMLKGRTFDSLDEQNAFLAEWDEKVANKRIHGSTKMQVAAAFELERPHLKPLPDKPFEMPQIGFRTVHADGFIEVGKAYYPIPDDYLGETVEVRYNERIVVVYDQKGNRIIAHPRQAAGQRAKRHFGRQAPPPTSRAAFEARVVARAERIGPSTASFAQAAIAARGTLAYRFLQGLSGLEKKYGTDLLETVSAEAQRRGLFAYQPFVALCTQYDAQLTLDNYCQQQHEIIRDLREYQEHIE